MVIGRSWWAIGLACVTALGFAQGGQGGGFGGGGFGGGGGAAQGGIQGPEGQVTNRQLFLTPGDRTEWEFDAKADEAMVVTITSQVFDPAVAVVDDKGAKLAENDDIEPGNQMARLLFVAPKEGKYKVVVTNYKGTAGGAFSFESRRFLTFPVKFAVPTEVPADKRPMWGRVTIDKPGEYVAAIRTRSEAGVQSMDPTGDTIQGMESYEQNRGYVRFRFTAKVAGPFLFQSPNATQIHVLPVENLATTVGTTATQVLEMDQYENWTFDGKKDDVLEVSVTGKGEIPQFSLEAPRGRRDGTLSTPYALMQFGTNPRRWTIRMFKDAPVDVRVWMPEGRKTTYELTVRPVGRPLPKTPELTSKLDWFASDVWTFEGRPGDVTTFRIASDTFMPYLYVMTPEGQVVGTQMEGVPPVGTLPIEVKKPGRYVMIVTGGGIGTYRLQQRTVEPKALGAGVTRGEIKQGPEVWRFRAEKGQDLGFRVSSPTLRWNVQITGPDGKEVVTLRNVGTASDDFARLKIEASGDYTVTVTGLDGTSGAYEIKRIDLDK